MKKIVKVLALAAMLVMGGQAMAQTRGAMFLSASFPLKDYAEFDDFTDFALTALDSDADNCGAGIGFNVGFKWYFNVGVEGLGVMLSLDGIYNGPNPDLKAAYRDLENSYNGHIYNGSFKYNSKPQFINAPLMLGLNYIYHFNPNFGIYVEAGAGGNFRFISSMETVGKSTLLNVETQTTTTQKYDMGFGFAYQAGIGFEVAKNLVIGCSFYDLGKATVKGEQTTRIKTQNLDPTTSTKYQELGKAHPMMIMARIGFSF